MKHQWLTEKQHCTMVEKVFVKHSEVIEILGHENKYLDSTCIQLGKERKKTCTSVFNYLDIKKKAMYRRLYIDA